MRGPDRGGQLHLAPRPGNPPGAVGLRGRQHRRRGRGPGRPPDAGAPRLAVLDWMMPHVDGVEVCRRVRSQASAEPPYIVLLTARADSNDVVAGLESGADDYLTKPVDRAELRARLQAGRRVVELQASLAAGSRAGVGPGPRQATPAAAAHLLLLQEGPRRRELLAAGRGRPRRPCRREVQPRHLPRLLRARRRRIHRCAPVRGMTAGHLSPRVF